MAEENTNAVSSREKLLQRAREYYPDRTFADIGATEVPEGAADLDDAINEKLEELVSQKATYDENNNRLTGLLVSDPSAAEFIQKWIDGGDPRTAIVETFGDDLGMNEESQGRFKEQLEGWRARKAENDKLNEEADANWQASLSALEEWGNAKGLDIDKKRDVMLRLLSITFNGMENKYGAEDFDLAYNAINHDTDVAAARAEGEVAGRNAKINAARRDRSVAGAMPPSSTGGQGGTTIERKPKFDEDNPFKGIK